MALALRSVRVVNIDDAESTMSANQVLLSNSDANPERFIISDTNEELLIILRFKDFVDIQSMKIYALSLSGEIEIKDASPPKQIHIFKLSNLNQDFDDIKQLKPHTSTICSGKKLSKGQAINLETKVKYLAIFFASNQRDTQSTYFHGVTLKIKGIERTPPNMMEPKSAPIPITEQKLTEDTVTATTTNELFDHLKELWDIDESERRKGIKLVQKICSNVLKDPSNPKFRDLNFAKIGERLDECQPALMLLFDVGFTLSADGERLQLQLDELNIETIRALKQQIQVIFPMGNINQMCYCSNALLADTYDYMTAIKFCRRCLKQLNGTKFYCGAGEDCCFERLTRHTNGVCSECYNANVPEEVMKNDLYFGNVYDGKSVLIHRKGSVSLDRIS